MIAKRYKAAELKSFLGFLRYLTYGNAPLLAALNRLCTKRAIGLAEQVAIDCGFFALFRGLLAQGKTLPKRADGSAADPKDLDRTVFEFSRVLFTGIVQAAQKASADADDKARLEAVEDYADMDFMCAYSLKHINFPVVLTTDKKEKKLCDKDYMEQMLGKPVQDVAVLRAENLAADRGLVVLMNAYYNNWADSYQFWQGNGKFDVDYMKSLHGKYPLSTDWDVLGVAADGNEYFRIYNSFTIKYYGNFPCLIHNPAGEFAIGEQIMECGTMNVYYDVTTEASESIMQAAAQGPNPADAKIKDEVIITQEPEEVIVLLFDTSGSMQSEYVKGLERINAAKTFFNAFADRAIAYKLKLAICLIMFSDKVEVVCQFTERFRSFKSHVELCLPKGTTKLYDALITAAEQLEKLGATYTKALKRVICFSDGEDVGSTHTDFDVIKRLRSSRILLDSVLVGNANSQLKAMSLSTGGCTYFFSEVSEGLQLFESETFLRAVLRYAHFLISRTCNREKTLPPAANTMEEYSKLLSCGYCAAAPNMQVNPMLQKKVADPKQYVSCMCTIADRIIANAILQPPSIAHAKPGSVVRLKRILAEISRLNKNPQDYFYFFPSDQDIGFWKIIMVGPSGSPYDGCTFVLYATFPEEYPAAPPEVRFFTPIIHCNINKTGKICHPIFNLNYSSSITMKEIFAYIAELLIMPNLDDQVDNSLAQEYYTNKDLYMQKVTDYATKYGKVSLLQRLQEIGQSPAEIKLQHPKEYLDPLTNELMLDPVISPVSGVTYHRPIIVEFIRKNGKDPTTGKPLQEDQLIPNASLKAIIEKYYVSLQGGAWFNS